MSCIVSMVATLMHAPNYDSLQHYYNIHDCERYIGKELSTWSSNQDRNRAWANGKITCVWLFLPECDTKTSRYKEGWRLDKFVYTRTLSSRIKFILGFVPLTKILARKRQSWLTCGRKESHFSLGQPSGRLSLKLKDRLHRYYPGRNTPNHSRPRFHDKADIQKYLEFI